MIQLKNSPAVEFSLWRVLFFKKICSYLFIWISLARVIPASVSLDRTGRQLGGCFVRPRLMPQSSTGELEGLLK